jgi:hypothetical protein
MDLTMDFHQFSSRSRFRGVLCLVVVEILVTLPATIVLIRTMVDGLTNTMRITTVGMLDRVAEVSIAEEIVKAAAVATTSETQLRLLRNIILALISTRRGARGHHGRIHGVGMQLLARTFRMGLRSKIMYLALVRSAILVTALYTSLSKAIKELLFQTYSHDSSLAWLRDMDM